MRKSTCPSTRTLLGIDLSPCRVSIAGEKLGHGARVVVGDMRTLDTAATGPCAAVLNFFALHHLAAEDAQRALGEWFRPGARRPARTGRLTGRNPAAEPLVLTRQFKVVK